MTDARPELLTVPLNTADGTCELFVVPGMDGQLTPFSRLDGLLTGVMVSGLVFTEPPAAGTTVSDLAKSYMDTIEATRTTGDVLVSGFSFGAYVATEMALLAVEAGSPFRELIVIDTVPQPGPQRRHGPPQGQWNIGRNHGLPLSWEEFSALSKEDQISAVCRHWPDAPGRPRTRAFVAHLFATIDVHFAAFNQYVLRPYPGRVSAIATWDGRAVKPSPQLWYPAYPGGVALELIRGTHTQIATGARGPDLARALERLIHRP